MIEFVGVIRDVKAADIQTTRSRPRGKNICGSDVLIWHKNSDNMQAILNIFRGLAPLANAPEQQFEDTTTTSTDAARPRTTTAVVRRRPTPPLRRRRAATPPPRQPTTPLRCRTHRRPQSSRTPSSEC